MLNREVICQSSDTSLNKQLHGLITLEAVWPEKNRQISMKSFPKIWSHCLEGLFCTDLLKTWTNYFFLPLLVPSLSTAPVPLREKVLYTVGPHGLLSCFITDEVPGILWFFNFRQGHQLPQIIIFHLFLIFYNTVMWKMYIQYMVLGFEPITSWTRVSSHNHLIRADALLNIVWFLLGRWVTILRQFVDDLAASSSSFVP